MKSKNTLFKCTFFNQVPSGELLVHPLALTLAQDPTTGNSWLREVGQGHSPFRYSAPSDLRHPTGLELG